MNKPPAFQFYAKDWLSSKTVMKMTPQQRGYYICLLAHAWDSEQPGTLPNDPAILWRMAMAESREEFERDGALVLENFPVVKSGRNRSVLRFNAKLVSYYRASCTRSKRKSEAAKKRWQNQLQADASVVLCPASSSASASASAKINTTPPIVPLEGDEESPRLFQPKSKPEYTQEFLRLWKEYPRTDAKFAAFKAFQKLRGVSTEKIIASIREHRKLAKWNENGGEYIPYLAKFLNQRRFEDELDAKWEN